jgi:hypothetical protein
MTTLEEAAHEYACRNGANPYEHGCGGVYRATTMDFIAGARWMDDQRAMEALNQEKRIKEQYETIQKLIACEDAHKRMAESQQRTIEEMRGVITKSCGALQTAYSEWNAPDVYYSEVTQALLACENVLRETSGERGRE